MLCGTFLALAALIWTVLTNNLSQKHQYTMAKSKSKKVKPTRRDNRKQRGRRPRNGERAKRFDIVYSQNVHGIFERTNGSSKRSYAKLEFAVKKMQDNRINVYLMQETWDENDWIKEREDGYTVFHHNNDSKQSRTGVAIILSPRYSKAWKTAGGLDPIQTPKGKFEGRFMGLCLQFPVLNAKGFPVKNKNIRVALATVYHPYDDTYSEFNSLLDDLIEKLPPSKGIIMGGDMNAAIGIGDCEALNDVLGPYGMPKRNEKGRDLLQTYQSNNLRIMNTFFKSQTHVSHVSINEQKTKCMLDMTWSQKACSRP